MVGEGTTFRIFLPRHIPVAGEVAEPAQADKAAEEEKRREDEYEARED